MKEYIIKVDETKPDAIGSFPVIEKRELVRCRDCKHFRSEVRDEFTTYIGCSEKYDTWGENWFCPDGKREEKEK